MLNKDKASIFFNHNTPSDVRHMIIQIFVVKATGTMEKYLGLPTLIGRSKNGAFQRLIDKTWQRITNWIYLFLVVCGKEIILKLVLQVIPTYTIGIFKLPKSITP